MANERTTEEVVQHHVQALMKRDVDEIMKDYAEESVMFSPNGTVKGLAGIRAAFTGIVQMFSPEVLANMKTIKTDTIGEYSYALWSALPAVTFGGDSFHVRDGKILMQSFVGQMGPQ